LGTARPLLPVLYWAARSVLQQDGSVTTPEPSCCSGLSNDSAQLNAGVGR
jgi:hypothetical protein